MDYIFNSAVRPFTIINNAVRGKDIVGVLLRFGFEDFLQRIGVPQKWLERFIHSDAQGLDIWERIRSVFEALGPTFVKFGQILSTRHDVLPEAFTEELKKLRNQVKTVPFESMEPVLNQELGCPWQDVLIEFDQVPVAAGSLGQVYRARLKETGEAVAVKIQRPGLLRMIEADFEIIGWFANKMHERIPELKPFDIPGVVAEAKIGLIREIDFSIEARNAIFFNNLNPFPEKVFAPKVYESMVRRRLVVTEWVDGRIPGEAGLSPEEGKTLAEAGGTSVFHQIVMSGFFHADPHPANVLITQDGRLCFIDWGLAGQLTREMRYFLADLFVAITSGDPEKVVRVGMRMAKRNRRVDNQALEKEIAFCLHKYSDFDIGSEAMGHLMIKLLYIFGSNGIEVVRDYTFLAKAVISIEETGKCLDPHFDIRSIAKPFLEKLVWERWNPMSMGRQVYHSCYSAFTRLKEIPGDVQRLLRRIEDEDLSLKIEHRGIQPFADSLSTIANRLVLSIVIGALIIGSSIVITTDLPPLIWGYSAIGLVGYEISAFLGIWMVIEILRHGRHKEK
ncbi:MAG TPA: ABC transporter [Opitutae bacterium]|nr:ABC transporter [Opitutae bacterium]